MADITAINYYRPKKMVPDGRGCTIIEKAAIPASTVIGTKDTVSFAMPAGVTVHRLRIHSDDIDAGTAMVFRAGYLKQNSADTLTADDDYFAAAGQALVQAGGGLAGLQRLLDLLLDVGVDVFDLRLAAQVARPEAVSTSRIEQGDGGAVHDALRPDIHKGAGGHLTILRNSNCLSIPI